MQLGPVAALGLVAARLITGGRFPEPPKHPRRHITFVELVSTRVREALGLPEMASSGKVS